MTAPERRRPLPALAFIGALSLLTALVWFRVLHRSDNAAGTATHTATQKPCPTVSTSSTPVRPPKAPTVLPIAAKVSVRVLNSTDRNGIAGATTKVLKKDGFQTAKAQDDTASYGGHGLIKGVAEIRYPPRQLPAATLLSYYFPQAALVPTRQKGSTVLVSLGAKYKHVAKPKKVKHALKRDGVKLKHHQVLSAPVPVPTPSKTPSRCVGKQPKSSGSPSSTP